MEVCNVLALPEVQALLPITLLTSPLEQFVLLAKSARGAAAVELIKQVLEAPTVFVFGELLDCENIQALENTEHAPYLNLLNIFAYGTFSSLLQNASNLPKVSETMARKLRLLTVITLAETSRLIPYNHLQQELQVQNERELEDLLIEGISGGAVGGKLDQKSRVFEVDFVSGRDIRKIDIGNIVQVLKSWGDNCEAVIDMIDKQVQKVNTEREDRKAHEKKLEEKISKVKEKAKLQHQNGHDHDDPESRMERDGSESRGRESRGRPGGSRMKGKKNGGGGGGLVGGFWK